ncbi:MAG: histidine phosphatase family protein [Pseudomonadota bacterium]
MRRLILMRHAKSSWDDPDLEDRERPLNGRGRLAATLMGAWLRDEGLIPDHALLSPAVRVAQTWARASAAGGFAEAEVAARAELYMAEPAEALEVLRRAPEAAETLLMLGHEPGMTALLRRLADGSEAGGCRRAYEKFPTAAAAALDLPDGAGWAQLAERGCAFRRFACPKDLV